MQTEHSGEFYQLGFLFVLYYINTYAGSGLNLANTELCKTPETLAHGYSCESTQWELSNEYQHDRI